MNQAGLGAAPSYPPYAKKQAGVVGQQSYPPYKASPRPVGTSQEPSPSPGPSPSNVVVALDPAQTDYDLRGVASGMMLCAYLPTMDPYGAPLTAQWMDNPVFGIVAGSTAPFCTQMAPGSFSLQWTLDGGATPRNAVFWM